MSTDDTDTRGSRLLECCRTTDSDDAGNVGLLSDNDFRLPLRLLPRLGSSNSPEACEAGLAITASGSMVRKILEI